MRKIILFLIISFFCFMVYNSKSEYCDKSKKFKRSNFNGEILKIIEGRGTKIYYENNNYFYASECRELKIKVGDIVSKSRTELIVKRKNLYGQYIEIGKKIIKESNESYFNYFFGI